MKKMEALAATIVLAVCLSGCGDSGSPTEVTTAVPAATTEALTTEQPAVTEAPTTEQPVITEAPTTEQATATESPATEQGGSTEASTGEKKVELVTMKLDNVEYGIPVGWVGDGTLDEDGDTLFFTDFGVLLVEKQEIGQASIQDPQARATIVNELQEPGLEDALSSVEMTEVDGCPAFKMLGEAREEGDRYQFNMIFVQVESRLYIFDMISYEGFFDTYTAETEAIFGSIRIK